MSITQYHDTISETEYVLICKAIVEAKECIATAEALLSQRYHYIIVAINNIDELLNGTAVESKHATTVVLESVNNKDLYRKIAKLTHPDTGIGDPQMFVEAKIALKRGDTDALQNILNCAKKNYAELLQQSKADYHFIITSDPYSIASDYLSGDPLLQSKAEAHYSKYLHTTLHAKTIQLRSKQTA